MGLTWNSSPRILEGPGKLWLSYIKELFHSSSSRVRWIIFVFGQCWTIKGQNRSAGSIMTSNSFSSQILANSQNSICSFPNAFILKDVNYHSFANLSVDFAETFQRPTWPGKSEICCRSNTLYPREVKSLFIDFVPHFGIETTIYFGYPQYGTILIQNSLLIGTF